jgi:radical SAM superfamily enzyme YgiQ (UPF0313 family)
MLNGIPAMKALFVDISHNFFDKNWVYCLLPVLKARGVEASYMNVRSLRSPARHAAEAARQRPDLVLYSAFTADIPKVAAFDRALKQLAPCRSIMGGSGPTFDWTCHHGTTLDAVCVGEGEFALGDYIDSGLKSGRNIIPAGASRPEKLAELLPLDAAPMPDRELVYRADPVLAAISAKQFMAGRGCPYQCTYCFNHAFNEMFKGSGPVVRLKPVDSVLEEIRQVRRRYPLSFVSFQDDTFILDRRWLLEFCEKFPAEFGLPFSCSIRANLVDEESAAALRRGGCAVVSWSVECGNDRLRNEVLRRNMSREAILRAAACLRKHGIQQRVASLMGIPGETMAELHETIRLNIAIRPCITTANIFVPYPGLQLTQHALAHGHLRLDQARDLPRDIFTRSVLEFPRSYHTYLRKTSCLMPFLARFGWAFETPLVRRLLYALPWVVLRAAYEAQFLIACLRLYRIGGSWRLRWRIFLRYLQNLL